jgi:hypothetical protein
MVALTAKHMEHAPFHAPKASDTLHVEFPSCTTHFVIMKTLAQFGDVTSFDLIPGPPGLQLKTMMVSVVYFDVRAAQRVVDVLGQRCTLMPRSIDRLVRMGGSVQLDAQGIQGVSNVCTDPGDQDSFMVEFFDSRDAVRAHEAVYYAYMSEAQEGEMQTQDRELHSTQVIIRGLPNGICTRPMMQAVLEQAGLEESIVTSEAHTGDQCGHFVLTLSTQQAIDKCVEHFNGCKWDARVVVSVEIQQTQPRVARKSAVSAVVAPPFSGSEAECGGSDDDQEIVLAPPGLERSSIQASPLHWAKSHKPCSSRVTASTCSSEPHSDVEYEPLAA